MDRPYSNQMKEHRKNKESLNENINTLENIWSKKQKPNELLDSAVDTSNTDTVILTEKQTTLAPCPEDEDLVVVSCKTSPSCDLSVSAEQLPIRPILTSYPVSKENRSFQPQWYQNHPWREYSNINDSTYCYYCRHVGQSIQSWY